MKKIIQHGNAAKIDPKKPVTPVYLTNTITPKVVQIGNIAPNTIEENSYVAKKEVDDNHK